MTGGLSRCNCIVSHFGPGIGALGKTEGTRVATVLIIVAVDKPDEVQAVAEWFDRWRDRLTAVSENTGYGCCVDIWNLEGPADALAELPDVVIADIGVEP